MARWIIVLVLTGVVHDSTTQQSPSEDNLENKFGIGHSNHNKLNKERFNFFDSELLTEIVNRNDGNIVISSASIKTVLSMILEGSQGKTYNELIMLMRLPTNHTAVQTILHDFQASLHNSNKLVTMKSASKIFISQDLSSDPRYKKLLQEYYHADIDHTNFATPEITAYNINNWVKSHTQGFISNLIDPASIHPDSHLILTNAMFFKGEWESEFQPSNTVVECFYPTPDECKKAYMMTSVGVFNYTAYTVLDAQAIQLPYQGGKYSMIVLLPARKDAIFNLNRDLVHRSLQDIVNSMDEKEIVLKLPRFTIEFKTDLVDILQRLGAPDMFSDNANMPGIITGGKRAKVNAFVHSAKIEVNEKGTKAGAATAGSVVPLSGYVPQFTANHPFFFYIYDANKNSIIFSGKLSSPDDIMADSNQLVQVETLSAQVPQRERPTITSHEPQSRPYPISGSGQIVYQRGSTNQQGERYGNNNDKPIRFP